MKLLELVRGVGERLLTLEVAIPLVHVRPTTTELLEQFPDLLHGLLGGQCHERPPSGQDT